VGSCLWFDRRRTNSSVTSTRTYDIFIIIELSPVCHSLLAAPLPLLLGQHSELLYNLLGLQLLHFSIICRMLQFNDMIFFILQIFEYSLTVILILFVESRIRQRQLTILRSFFILLLSLKLSPFLSLSHDSQIYFSFLWLA